MKQYAEKKGLRLLDCSKGPVLYDTNRVTTYLCSAAEAHLLQQDDTATADSSGQAVSFDAETLETARRRIGRLSKLSESLSDFCGINPSYNGRPSYLFMNVCSSCNLKCIYCYADGCGLANETRLMSEQTAKSSIDFLLKRCSPNEHYVISFAGGEPLLNFEVIKSVTEYALKQQRARGVILDLRLLTNGTLMSPEILEFISKHGIFVQISLDGPPDVHDRLRPTKRDCGSSERILETIKLFEDSGFTRFRVRATVCHMNSDVKEIEKYYREKGLKNFSLQPSMSGKDTPYRLRTEDMQAITGYYEQLAAEVLDGSRSGASIDVSSDIAVLMEKLALGIKTKRFCGAGREMLVVNPDGHFYPCPSIAGDARFKVGSVENGLCDTRHGAFPNRSVDDKRICGKCWARNLCGGGCSAQALRLNGDFEDPDPMECALNKARIKGAIDVYHHLKDRNATGAGNDLCSS